MDNFANIGKAILLQALGIQKNYTEEVESNIDVIDYNNTLCLNCKHKAIINTFDSKSEPYINSCLACESCPHRSYTKQTVLKKIYHNEKNRYGYRPMLKSNAIKLLLALHFYHPDKFGIIKNIDVNELASLLNCHVRTIWNNLEVLSLYSYITFERIDSSSLNIILNDYEKYFLPANKNGRGFIVLSKDLFLKILKIESLVTLRIYLRELINLDNPNLKGQASVDYKKISEIRNTLPKYCKPCIIKQKIKTSYDIFFVSVENNKLRFEIDSRFIPKNQKEHLHKEYMQLLNTFMLDFNTFVPIVNSNQPAPDAYQEFFNLDDNNHIPYYCIIKLSPVDIDELANVALHYSFELVIDALTNIYKEYILTKKEIKNFAGLVSTIIRAKLNNSKKAA